VSSAPLPAAGREASSSISPLVPVLRPASVAVVGASSDPAKRGHRAVLALLEAGYAGRIIPVNPAGGTLLGLPVVRGPYELEAPPDLALVCTPAATVPRVLEEWGEGGTRGAVVLAGGFGEAGPEGQRLERELAAVIERTGIRVVGPNTSGILNVPLGLNLIGLPPVGPGTVSLLVQSGNVALALATEARRAGVGFNLVIGVGNETGIRFHEYLDFLAEDPGTAGILVHAEGFRDASAFLDAARRAARAKPVVMLKGARTEVGGTAARSHTGAVAGSYAALRAGLRQAGVVEVTRTDEALPAITTLAEQPLAAPGRGIAILSDGGGHATLAVDDLHERGAALAPLHPATSARLRALLGPAAAVRNPVDLAGAADRDPLAFARTLEVLVRDPAVATVLVVGLFGGYAIRFAGSLLAEETEAARLLPGIAREAGVGLVVHSLYASSGSEPLRELRERRVPVVESLDVACRCVAALLEGGEARRRAERLAGRWPAGAAAEAGPTRPPAGDALAAARAEGRAFLLEPEVRRLVEPFGVPTVPGRFCAGEAEVAAAAAELGVPLAVRVVAPAVPHKTEAGGVALDVAPAQARAVAARMRADVSAWLRGRGEEADIRGFLLTPMLGRPLAELLVGVVRDPQLGPVLRVGAGGTLVELHRDVATRVLPVGPEEVDEMLGELRIAPLLDGYRGAAACDRRALVRAVLSLCRCALETPDVAEIEVNPLFARADGALAVDVRAFID
jgi:acetate---CoA ligase (ADP-forming)